LGRVRMFNTDKWVNQNQQLSLLMVPTMID